MSFAASVRLFVPILCLGPHSVRVIRTCSCAEPPHQFNALQVHRSPLSRFHGNGRQGLGPREQVLSATHILHLTLSEAGWLAHAGVPDRVGDPVAAAGKHCLEARAVPAAYSPQGLAWRFLIRAFMPNEIKSSDRLSTSGWALRASTPTPSLSRSGRKKEPTLGQSAWLLLPSFCCLHQETLFEVIPEVRCARNCRAFRAHRGERSSKTGLRSQWQAIRAATRIRCYPQFR